MDRYNIFWIKSEFAKYYFYKNDILFRFLKLFQKDKERPDLLIQYRHITCPFSINVLYAHFKEHHQHNISIGIINNIITLTNEDSQKYITLHIKEKHLEFYTESLSDAEDILFPVLKLFQPFLFIMNENTDDYGWISPVKKSYSFKNSPGLYSYL